MSRTAIVLIAALLLLFLNLRIFYLQNPMQAGVLQRWEHPHPAAMGGPQTSLNHHVQPALSQPAISHPLPAKAMQEPAQSALPPENALNSTGHLAALTKEQAAHETQGKGYLAMCVVARDVHRDIREWVLTHLFMGVEKIFVNDHNSEPAMHEELKDFISIGLVEYKFFKGPVIQHMPFPLSTQGRIWRTCIERAAGKFRWMAFTDVDEFIIVRGRTFFHSIPSVLKQYESSPALALPWVVFGSSGLENRTTPTPVLRTFTKCGIPRITHVKVIAQIDKIESLGEHPHRMFYKGGGLAVTEDLRQVHGHLLNQASHRIIAIHHYLTKSKAEYLQRVRKYRQGMSGWVNKTEALLGWADGVATSDCPQGADLSRHIESRLLGDRSGPDMIQSGLGSGNIMGT